jgi:hypothetical protein
MTQHLIPHKLTAEELGRRDAEQARHGAPVSNPYVEGSWQAEAWSDGHALRLAELDTEELLRNAKRTDLEAA